MGLLDASMSSGGSQNSAQSTSQSWSNTAGATASAWSAEQAKLAHERQKELLNITQEYNSKEAQKARDWEERLANTIYTRSIQNMREAGLNPVLAAGMGLSAAGVGGGASASISTPSTFMPQSIAEQNAASNSQSESSGSAWNRSESGLATFLESMGTWVNGMIGALSSSHTINIALQGLENALPDNTKTGDGKTVGQHKKEGTYDQKVSTTFNKWIKNPKEVTSDILKYITMKNSGGMIK